MNDDEPIEKIVYNLLQLKCNCGPENERRKLPCENCLMKATKQSQSGWQAKVIK
jgi:hypothetical protein